MSKLDKDQVIAKFTEAYTAAHGKAPEIEAKGGWYSVDGGKNVRLAQLDEMADQFADSAEETTEAKSTDVTPSEAPKAPINTEQKAAPKSTSGFSVKQFWNARLNSENPGSTYPR